MIQEYQKTTRTFEESWTDEMKEIVHEQEDPEHVRAYKERTTIRLNKLNKTIEALTSERGKSSL